MFLPSIAVNPDELFNYAASYISKQPLPRDLSVIDIDKSNLNIVLKQQRIINLHMAFSSSEFLDIIYDSDIRRKIDAMSISPLFRREEIYREFPNIQTMLIDTYIECFANFDYLKSKTSYVNRYIGDEEEKMLLIKVLETSSKKYLKLIIGLKGLETSPLELINRALNITTAKVETALIKNEDDKLDKYLRMQVMISEKLHKLGAGSKSDLEVLLETLRQVKPDYEDPRIYSKKELDEEFASKKENA